MSFDEIEGSPLTLLLFHERLYFPLLLDHAMQEGFSELLLFLIETDKLRMEEDLENPSPPSPDVIKRIYDTYLASTEGCVYKCAQEAGIDCERICRIVYTEIPLQTVFASVCECVWEQVLKRTKLLPQCNMWPSVRRTILADEKPMELLTVLTHDSYRLYYERYNRANPSDLACVHCWFTVRDMLQRARNLGAGMSAITTAGKDSASNVSRVRRYSSIAAAGARHALLTLSGSSQAQVNKSIQLGQDLDDPLAVLKMLLIGVRKLQQNFFQLQGPSNSSSGLEAEGRGRASTTTKRMAGDKEKEMLTTQTMQGLVRCAGITDTVRVELTTTLTMAKDVRTNDIEAVDPAFAVACAGSLLRILQVLERETFQHLQAYYPAFLDSVEYTLLIASIKAAASQPVQRYVRRCLFLEDRVRREKFIPWTDPEAKGRTYVLCDRHRHSCQLAQLQHQHHQQVVIAVAGRLVNEIATATSVTADTPRDGLQCTREYTATALWCGSALSPNADGAIVMSPLWDHAQQSLPSSVSQAEPKSLSPASVSQAVPIILSQLASEALCEALAGHPVINRFLALPRGAAPVSASLLLDTQSRKSEALCKLLEFCMQHLHIKHNASLAATPTKNSDTHAPLATGGKASRQPCTLQAALCVRYDDSTNSVRVSLVVTAGSHLQYQTGIDHENYYELTADEGQEHSTDDADGISTRQGQPHVLPLVGSTPQLSLYRAFAQAALTVETSSETEDRVLSLSLGAAAHMRFFPTSVLADPLQEASLLDLYVQYGAIYASTPSADIAATPKKGNNSTSPQLKQEAAAAAARSTALTIQRYLGTCDFSLARVLCRIPSRTLLQILLLTLTGRSVVLLGHSPTLISELMAALPRLVWPFQLLSTHILTQLHTSAEFVYWISNNQQSFQGLVLGAPGSPTVHSRRSDQHRAWIVGSSHEAFDGMTAEQRKQLLIVTENNAAGPDRWPSGVLVLDVDRGEIRFGEVDPHAQPHGSASLQHGSHTHTGADLRSKLVSSYALRRLHSRAFEILEEQLQAQRARFHCGDLGDLAPKRHTRPHSCAIPMPVVSQDTASSNSEIEGAFARYFANLFLRFLPQNILYYPQQAVVACDVRRVLTQLTTRARAQYAEAANGAGASVPRTAPGCNANSPTALPELSEVEVEFVAELIGLGSPSFRELLIRQGVALMVLEGRVSDTM